MVRSSLSLPALRCSDDAGPCDITIVEGQVEHPTGDEIVAGSADDLRFRDPLGYFRAERGQRLTIEFDPAMPAEAVPLLVGRALGYIFLQRGHLVLHGSGALLDGSAMLFCGDPGRGKSTLTAACVASGQQLICDDVAVIDQTNPLRPQLRAGLPVIRQWPDALRATGGDPAVVEPLVPGHDKRLRSVDDQQFCDDTSPLAAILLLEAGEPRCEQLPTAQAAIELVRHSYTRHTLRAAIGQTRHLDLVARLAEAVGVFRLFVPRNLERLAEAVTTVRQIAATLRD